MSEVKRLLNEQQFLISECKRQIESNKLSLWGFKAELNTLTLQYKKVKQNLENQEKNFYALQREVAGYTREMKLLEDTLAKCSFEVLVETLNPYPIIQDISSAICIQIGSQTPSWRSFRKLLKDNKSLIEALKSFDQNSVSSEQMKYFAGLYKKHNLSLTLKDSKLPEEFLSFAGWFMNSYLFALKEQESRSVCSKIVSNQKEAARVYMEIKDIRENIIEREVKLEKLLSQIEKADKNINALGISSDDDLESIRKNCEKVENAVKKISIPESMTGESNAPSILVESLFIQNSNSFNFDDLIDRSSESRALISMEDMESSIPKEAYKPIAKIVPEKRRRSSKKKRCCGFG